MPSAGADTTTMDLETNLKINGFCSQVALNVAPEFGVGTRNFEWPVCTWVTVYNNAK